jgi:hypothetical protein
VGRKIIKKPLLAAVGDFFPGPHYSRFAEVVKGNSSSSLVTQPATTPPPPPPSSEMTRHIKARQGRNPSQYEQNQEHRASKCVMIVV